MKIALGILALALLAGFHYEFQKARRIGIASMDVYRALPPSAPEPVDVPPPFGAVWVDSRAPRLVSCAFDSQVASGNYAVPSRTISGTCHDTLIKESEAVKDSLGQYIGVIKEVVTKGGNGIGDIAQVEIKR